MSCTVQKFLCSRAKFTLCCGGWSSLNSCGRSSPPIRFSSSLSLRTSYPIKFSSVFAALMGKVPYWLQPRVVRHTWSLKSDYVLWTYGLLSYHKVCYYCVCRVANDDWILCLCEGNGVFFATPRNLSAPAKRVDGWCSFWWPPDTENRSSHRERLWLFCVLFLSSGPFFVLTSHLLYL